MFNWFGSAYRKDAPPFYTQNMLTDKQDMRKKSPLIRMMRAYENSILRMEIVNMPFSCVFLPNGAHTICAWKRKNEYVYA